MINVALNFIRTLKMAPQTNKNMEKSTILYAPRSMGAYFLLGPDHSFVVKYSTGMPCEKAQFQVLVLINSIEKTFLISCKILLQQHLSVLWPAR